MQVNNSGVTNNPNANPKQRVGGEKGNDAGQPASASPSPNNVELSSQAQGLQKLEVQIASAADVDTAKVDRIRQAIEDGTYQIDAENIASKLLEADSLL